MPRQRVFAKPPVLHPRMSSFSAFQAVGVDAARATESTESPTMAQPSNGLRAKTPTLGFTCEEPSDESEKLALLGAAADAEAAWLSRLETGGAMDNRGPSKDHRDGVVRVNGWEVVAPLGRVCCGLRKPRMIEVVTLRHANYGLRWKGLTPQRDHRNGSKHDAGGNAPERPAEPFCQMGPHWWLMAATFTVFLVVALIVTVLTVPQAGPGEAVMGILLSTACLAMYAKVGCSNPGIVKQLDEPLDEDYTYCGECDSYRPPGALHCMDCRVCIEGYDHHCPWTGKCVGRRNVKYFYAWLFFLVLAFVYEMIEFTTYMLPPEDQPRPFAFDDDDDDSFAARVDSIERTLAPRSGFRQP